VVKVAAVTATNPKKQTRSLREATKSVRTMHFPVRFSALITGS
jgi:hypothetical protein